MEMEISEKIIAVSDAALDIVVSEIINESETKKKEDAGGAMIFHSTGCDQNFFWIETRKRLTSRPCIEIGSLEHVIACGNREHASIGETIAKEIWLKVPGVVGIKIKEWSIEIFKSSAFTIAELSPKISEILEYFGMGDRMLFRHPGGQ